MLRHLWYASGPAIERKMRLFTLAAMQPALARWGVPACYSAAVVGWKHVDGTATPDELAVCDVELRDAWNQAGPNVLESMRLLNVFSNLFTNPTLAARALLDPCSLSGEPVPLITPPEHETCCEMLRDIFGNRGAPVPVSADWLTSTVVALVRGIDDDHAFDRLPILADALQDAGCDDPEILGHCRGNGFHVRGCWVVDALLGTGMTRTTSP